MQYKRFSANITGNLPQSPNSSNPPRPKLKRAREPKKTRCLPITTLLLAACLALITSCSSVPTKVDKGPIKAATFSFIDTGPRSAPAFADNRQHVHALIQQAIVRNLTGRGLTQVASEGDVTVAYLVIVGNNATTTAVTDYFGYGRDASRLHDKAHKGYTTSKNPNYFEAGSLLIDLIDTESFALLRRNYVTKPILRNASDDVRAENIQEAVDEVFRGLRLAK